MQLSLDIVEGLPPYTVRESARARRVRLTVSAREGLVVVVPRGFPQRDVPELVASREDWAKRALERVAERRAAYLAGADAVLPTEVELRATGERFDVLGAGSGRARATVRGDEIVVSGEGAARVDALRRWLDRAARDRLPAMLDELAEEYGLSYAAVRVRAQRTRWGSCSSRSTISLNRTLLFLPPELARSVMLHELVHTRYLDHSQRFWTEFERVDPHARHHQATLRDAGELVPPWADA